MTTGRTYTVRRDVAIPMTDGVQLRADVWLPDTGDAVPVLLQRMPYDKSSSFMSQHIVGLEIPRALDAGFAVVVQDARGRHASDGDFDAFVHEAADELTGDGGDWVEVPAAFDAHN